MSRGEGGRARAGVADPGEGSTLGRPGAGILLQGRLDQTDLF